jgi:decaprenylphospho-beta-D-erythro-pentofuranosid-2-ulose 2-reductase
MINAVGEPQSVLLLGGTSEIGWAILEALPRARLSRVVLAGRPSPELDARRTELLGRGIRSVEKVDFDALDTASHGDLVERVFDGGDIDVVILAFGVLGDQSELESDPGLAVQVIETNYVGAVSVGLHVARRLRAQGHGKFVVLSSVAGDRARRANFIYGSSKAGLDAFAQGLGDSLVGSGASVMVVRPGFVRTSMTEGLEEAPFATSADVVGGLVATGLAKGRETVYAPGVLRPVMGVIKALPRKVFRRLPG